MSSIVLIDTVVLLNILDVPHRNQSRASVLLQLGRMIDANDHLFIPMAAVVEVGNHIAQVPNGAHRRAAASRFVTEVRKALRNEAPWKPINFPTNEEMLGWLDAFPDAATQRLGMGDLSIKQEWIALCQRYPMSRVWVWTLDEDLANLDQIPGHERRKGRPN